MKITLLNVTTIGIVALATACNSEGKQPDDVAAAKDSNTAHIDTAANNGVAMGSDSLSKNDAAFLVDAAAGGKLEVEMGKIAEKNGQSPRVRGFGRMMIHDHSMGGAKVRGIAMKENIVLPDSVSGKQRDELNDLRQRTGPDFDKAYVDMMVKDHKDDIAEFKKESDHGTDSLIRMFATNSLDMLNMHLDSVQHIQNDMR
jgi:putative membrane protein